MIAMFAGLAGAAELWWVPDPETAASLRSALETDWTEGPVEVVVGGRPDEAWGWTWDGDTLAVHTQERKRVADADDPHVAVLFARTWNIRTEAPGWEQWLPAGEGTGIAHEGPTTAPSSTPSAAPAAEEERVAAVEEEDFAPVEAIRAQPDPGQMPWSLGLGLGARAMTQVPTEPGIRVPAELVVGSFAVAADFSADLYPWRLGLSSGLVSGVEDLFSAGIRSGIRSRGPTWMALTAGPQFRMAAPTLARDGDVIAQFTRPVMAGVLDLAVGQDLGVTRLALHTWVRTTYTLPLSAGVDLDVLLFVHERRRWR